MSSALPSAALASLAALALTLMPQAALAADYKHMGVASCATSVCHGKIAKQPDRNVNLNEYRVWSQDDKHSQAYKVLESPQSRAIAGKLGLASASTAKICLDCHADNVPAAQRGPKFQLRDGVGCEACHGGSERWLGSHSARAAKHADNLARGMYPSESPLPRAQLCLSCHEGTRDRLATHAIMGAGHPRLSFELEAFTANQPAHFDVDADYVQRKGTIPGVNLWLAGQLRGAAGQLDLLRSERLRPGGAFPELAFYDCHACHHPMDKLRWSRARAGAGAATGAPRLQTPNLIMLQAVAEALGNVTPGAPQLATATDAIVRAGHADLAAVPAASAAAAQWVAAHEGWAKQPFKPAETAAIRRMLLRYAASDRTADFVAAEQVVMGVESLSYSLGDRDQRKRALDALYDEVKSATSFDPARFAATARDVAGQF
jgi:hypothetical protein